MPLQADFHQYLAVIDPHGSGFAEARHLKAFQGRTSTVTTAGDKVQIVGAVVTLETARHDRSVERWTPPQSVTVVTSPTLSHQTRKGRAPSRFEAGREGGPPAPYLHICGDFICDQKGRQVDLAPASIRGLSEDSNFELSWVLGPWYFARINSNPILRIGPGYIKGGTRILRVTSGGPGLPWWWHIWNGPKWPF